MSQRAISLSHFGHDLITTAQPQNPNEKSSVVATRQFKVLCKTTSNTHHVLTLETGKRLYGEGSKANSVLRRILEYMVIGDICINGVLYIRSAPSRTSMIVCFDFSNRSRNAYGCSAFLTTLFHRQIIDYVADIICSAKLQQLLYLINHLQRQ
ncbi:hypothetical protein F2Q70_00036390 [Brassica cretica]|uniref:F-box associated beta-propeller type 3 domain-containing protein n=1 Tax=Brassica cretica TaxID=69181 RepID=A0A8S9JQ14_BRACR|nr:hypothetical protein F2Q70_00036390 [Brassica cretica]